MGYSNVRLQKKIYVHRIEGGGVPGVCTYTYACPPTTISKPQTTVEKSVDQKNPKMTNQISDRRDGMTVFIFYTFSLFV